MTETWMHIDMDAFFAAVEQRDHPEWRGKPVIIGAMPGHRGVVATASYEARVFGVRSAMPISQAYQRCPDGIYVRPDMARYHDASRRIMAIFAEHTPHLIQVSVDEAFLDLSGTRRLLGHPEDVARRIKQRVRDEIGLTMSAGIASNKYLAKIASGYRKPDGLTIIPEGGEDEFMARLPLTRLWGAGKSTLDRLERAGMADMEAVRSAGRERLRAALGASGGEFVHLASHGIDPGIYSGEALTHSISHETTFEEDVADPDVVGQTLFELANQVMFRLRAENAESRIVFVKLRDCDFTTNRAQRRLAHPVGSIEECADQARALLGRLWNGTTPVRLIGVGLDGVVPRAAAGPEQSELFDDIDRRRAAVERTVLDLRRRYRQGAIGKASTFDAADGEVDDLSDPANPGYDVPEIR